MPQSPFQRAAQEQTSQPESGSEGRKGKRKSKPTTSRRHKRQETKKRYSEAREDAQLQGLIPTTPEGAIKPEPVSPSVQGNQPMSELIAQAIRKGWAVPENRRPELIDEMIAIVLDNELPAKAKIAAFNALRMADQTQYERENPEAAGKAKGPTINGVPTGGMVAINVSVQSNKLAVNVLREHFESELGKGETGIPPLIEHSPTEPPRFDGEVESGAVDSEYNKE